jgi:hypothetical protein
MQPLFSFVALVFLLVTAFAAAIITAEKNILVEHSFDGGKSWQERGHLVRKAQQLNFKALSSQDALWTKPQLQ